MSHVFDNCHCNNSFYLGLLNMGGMQEAKYKDIMKHLKESYCGSITFEFRHIKVSKHCNYYIWGEWPSGLRHCN